MTRLIALNLILIFLASCSAPVKKEAYNPKAIELNNKAVQLMQRSQNDSALVLFDQAIELDPAYYLPHSNKTGIYISKKEFDKALAEIEMVIKKKPDFAQGWTIAGLLHEKLGDSISALKYYQKSVELFDGEIQNPEKKEQIKAIRLNRAISLVLAGNEKEGKEELEKLKAENPADTIINELIKPGRQDYLNLFFGNERQVLKMK